MLVSRYVSENKSEWDEFVSNSKNSTFLHHRGYMDYHADRFDDHSLMIRNDSGKLVALFPANVREFEISSHGGLTYGGVVSDTKMTTPVMMSVFEAIFEYYKDIGIAKILYKTIPHIYHRYPAEEDLYCLFLKNAHVYRRDVLAVLTPRDRLDYQSRRRRQIALANKRGLQVRESTDFRQFWSLLEKNLLESFGVKPVHTLEEIELLQGRFTKNIRLHVCADAEEIVAGVVVYLSDKVAHVQYISANATGKSFGALDLLFSSLIESTYRDVDFFDFGISNEKNGRYLNLGLIEQKEGFGARAVVHDCYEVDIS